MENSIQRPKLNNKMERKKRITASHLTDDLLAGLGGGILIIEKRFTHSCANGSGCATHKRNFTNQFLAKRRATSLQHFTRYLTSCFAVCVAFLAYTHPLERLAKAVDAKAAWETLGCLALKCGIALKSDIALECGIWLCDQWYGSCQLKKSDKANDDLHSARFEAVRRSDARRSMERRTGFYSLHSFQSTVDARVDVVNNSTDEPMI